LDRGSGKGDEKAILLPFIKGKRNDKPRPVIRNG